MREDDRGPGEGRERLLWFPPRGEREEEKRREKREERKGRERTAWWSQ